MAGITRIFTDEQRDAVARAAVDRGIEPARRISELAAAGELTDDTGAKLPAFAIKTDRVHDIKRRELKRRAGRAPSTLADGPAADALETLRKRLVSLADSETLALQRQQRRPGGIDTARAIRTAKLTREIAAMTGPAAERPAPPGKGPMAERTGGEIRTGPAAAILQDFRGTAPQTATPETPRPPLAPAPHTGESSAAQESPSAGSTTRDNVHTPRQHATEGERGQQQPEPGAFVREQIARRGLTGDVGETRG